MSNYKFIKTDGAPIKAWINGVPVEPEAEAQLRNMAGLPFIHKHVAVMPDVHLGKGATVGSVIPTKGAIVPAAVGVDIGCGMCAAMTDLVANDLPDSLADVRTAIEAAIPVGQRSHSEVPKPADKAWYGKLKETFGTIDSKHHGLTTKASPAYQLGTLGGGNHFIELCLDEADRVWVMLHSGSRNVGNRIGTYFISKAKEEMERLFIRLPDKDLAYLAEGSTLFDDYVEAVGWAQDYARVNRDLMLAAVVLDQGDTAGLFACGAEVEYVPPRSGRHHLHLLLATLGTLHPEGDVAVSTALGRASTVLRRRGLVIVLSDFYDEDRSLAEVRKLGRMGHDVIIVHVLAHEEMSLSDLEAGEFVDAETDARIVVDPQVAAKKYREQLQAFLARIADASRSEGLDYLRLVTGEPLEPALRRFLVTRRGTL